MRIRRRPLVSALALAIFFAGCGGREDRFDTVAPVVLVGIDGASWNAIESLWESGRLPHLKALAETGMSADLKPVASASPVIWTSIATGVVPERHGIEGFVVPTPTGDVPVSSSTRRVPAIWNMVTRVNRRVAVLGWWASWPAEPVNGIVVTDRAVRSVNDAFWPAQFADTFQQIVERGRPQESISSHSAIARQDRALAAVAAELVGQRFDLLLVYFRNVDAESHPHWKYFRPQDYAQVDPDRLARLAERVPRAYEEVDRAIGALRSAADPHTNFFIISDHGFRAVKREQYRIRLDLDRVLEHLGYLLHGENGKVDWSRSQAATWGSAAGMRIKHVRFGLSDREPVGPVSRSYIDELRERLSADLARVTYTSGAPAFRVRRPRADESERGADLTVVIKQERVTRRLEYRGEIIADAISGLYEITGSHDAKTEGIFIAAGPDIDIDSTVERVHSLDITPTLLYAMSLPIAQDFDGRPQIDLFDRSFRRRHPVRTIPSWGTRQGGEVVASEADEELKEELRALGYLD